MASIAIWTFLICDWSPISRTRHDRMGRVSNNSKCRTADNLQLPTCTLDEARVVSGLVQLMFWHPSFAKPHLEVLRKRFKGSAIGRVLVPFDDSPCTRKT